MKAAKQTNWFLTMDGLEDNQILYYADRPSYKFEYKLEKLSDGSEVLKPGKQIWKYCDIEVPTRPLQMTQSWIRDGGSRNITLINSGIDSKLLEQWYLQNANIIIKEIKAGRRIDINVITLKLNSTWARKIK